MAATSSNSPLAAAVRAVVEPVVAAHDTELFEFEVKGAPGTRVVRLVLDREEGLDSQRIEDVSRAVSAALDVDEELIPGAYTLEVTSPGVDRPLREARDFRRNVGRDVRIQRNDRRAKGTPGEVTGRVKSCDDDVVVLNVKGRSVEVPLDEIDHGKVVLPW